MSLMSRENQYIDLHLAMRRSSPIEKLPAQNLYTQQLAGALENVR